MLNALTIDVEDYWDVYSKDWLGAEIAPTEAIVRNTEWLLSVLDRFDVKATFFILGTVARQFPGLVRKIYGSGHEVGSHGMNHTQVFKQTAEVFREDVSSSRKLLEDVISAVVVGYRAAAFSITPKTKYALEILAEEGFEYDSSVFPIARKRYGWAGFSKDICRIKLPGGSSIVEIPISVVKFSGKYFPVGGGGYLRHFPYIYTSWGLKRLQKQRPGVVYIHPYEIDNEEMPLEVGHLDKERCKAAASHHRLQMRNRGSMKSKVERLISGFSFAPIRQVLNGMELATVDLD